MENYSYSLKAIKFTLNLLVSMDAYSGASIEYLTEGLDDVEAKEKMNEISYLISAGIIEYYNCEDYGKSVRFCTEHEEFARTIER